MAAGEVASLLAEYRVPVAVLNACQSAMQSGSEAGLAQRLAEAGVPVAVGMAYSVTVTAAERAMPVLYGRLARGADPVAAVHAARRELFEHPGRRAYFGQQLDLQDWMLPVVFAQQPLRIELRPMTGVEQAAFYGRAAKVGTSRRPSTGLSAGTWTSRRSSTGCWPVRTETSCWCGDGRGGQDHAAEPPGLVVAAYRPGRGGVPVLL